MSGSTMPLPTFLIIGAQKSATRWLRLNLGLHPDVYTAPEEPSFFNDEPLYRRKGLDAYRSMFPGWSGEPLVGEATPGYMIWRHEPDLVAARIKASLPEVRLLAILRNPVDRAQSAFVHHARFDGRLPSNANLLEIVQANPPARHRLNLIAGGWYAASLKPYLRLFGDQLLVLLHDDLKTDAVGLYERACRHVGAAPGFVPPDLAEVRYSNQRGRRKKKASLQPEERRALYAYFRDDIDELERMFGLDLSAWRPEGADAATPSLRVPATSRG